METNKYSEFMPVYMDYNATTPLDDQVIEEVSRSLKEDWGNPSSSYVYGARAKSIISKSRVLVAKMLNADPDDIVFTSGGTEANNVALLSAISEASTESPTDSIPHVISSKVEHDSVALVLKEQQRMGKIELSIASLDRNGQLSPTGVLSLVKDNTALITIMHANNESGVIMPIEEIGEQLVAINSVRAQKGLRRIIFHSDAAQTVGKISVDVQKLKVDLLTIVGHKFYAPRIGALFVRGVVKGTTVLKPMLCGGGQERGFRPGTENTPMIAGLGKAAELVCENLSIYTTSMFETRNTLGIKLKANIPGLKINFDNVDTILPNTLSICLPEGLKGAYILNTKCKGKLLASLGAACHSNTEKPSEILLASGLSSDDAARTIRLSVGRCTNLNDVKAAVAIMKVACTEAEPNH